MSVPGPSGLSTFSSPKKKRVKRNPLHSAEKNVVINIFKHVEESWSKDSYPTKNAIVDKTAEISGLSRTSVYRILKEKKQTGGLNSPPQRSQRHSMIDDLDELDLGAIRRKVHMFYFNNELPTIDKVLTAVNEDDTLPNFKRTTFYKILKKLQFKYARRSRKSALIDRDDIVLWRIKYLNNIVKMRNEGRKIYYTDETWLNEGHTMAKVWQDASIQSSRDAHRKGLSVGLKNPSGKGKRLIILHIGSNTGFLEGGDLIFEAKKSEGDYHTEMDAHNFEKWFSDILPKLEQNSVVVMDNAKYHSRQKEKIPTSSSKKSEIQAWLKEKNIQFDEKYVKSQLLEKIKPIKHNYTTYVIDEMAKEKGITVLRLPPYHCELNPIELIWAQIKGYVAKQNKSFKMAQLKLLLADALKNVTAEEWQNCIVHTTKEEEKMLKIDGIIDDVTDRFVIEVNDEITSEESD